MLAKGSHRRYTARPLENPMRSLIICTVFAFVSASALVACDTSVDAPAFGLGAESVSPPEASPSVDPLLVASCHVAFRDASGRIETARLGAAACVDASDCTIAIAETGCTGEVASAVSAEGEARFLSFVDRVDAHVCSGLPSACAPALEADPVEVGVACVASRCTLVE